MQGIIDLIDYYIAELRRACARLALADIVYPLLRRVEKHIRAIGLGDGVVDSLLRDGDEGAHKIFFAHYLGI